MDYETPQFFHVMQYAAGANRDVIDMVSGSPDWEPPESLRDGLREYAGSTPAEFQYAPSAGLQELRQEIATRRGVDRDQVLITNGAGEANHLAMAEALERGAGDEIVLPDPVYPYYVGRTNLLDATTQFVPAEDDGQLDPAAVRDATGEDTAAIVVNSPNNPTGAVYSQETVEELVAIAEATNTILISDEVYSHFDYTGTFMSALVPRSEHVVVTNSFSKSLAVTGLRVGYAVFPPAGGPTGDLREGARTRHMLTNVSTSRPAQRAVLHALQRTEPTYYDENRKLLRERIDTFTDALDAVGAEYTRPGGGFYIMARFDGFPGTMDNVERLIDEAGVAGMPGEAFGRTRTEWFRFAMVSPRIEKATERLEQFLG